jgi:hypothetical protein
MQGGVCFVLQLSRLDVLQLVCFCFTSCSFVSVVSALQDGVQAVGFVLFPGGCKEVGCRDRVDCIIVAMARLQRLQRLQRQFE